jgi:citrate lyase beta subunit
VDDRYLRRTWIITPATAPERFAKARHAGADVAMVDLEDSVAPGDKQRARTGASGFFDCTATTPRGVRINAPSTPDGARDLLELAQYPHKPRIVLVPKVEPARDVEIVAGFLDTPEHAPEIYALIETPRAIENVTSIVRAARLGGVVFGAADYAAAAGCRLTWEALLYARSALVNAAAARGVPAVDSPYFDLHDLPGLARESERARALGYCGKGAVHPRQVPVIDKAFTPTDEEVAAARTVLAAADASRGAITSVDGAMVGRPFFLAATTVAAQASTLGAATDIPTTRQRLEDPS